MREKGDNVQKESIQRKRDDNTSVRVNEGLDPVTCRVIRRSMVLYGDRLEPICCLLAT